MKHSVLTVNYNVNYNLTLITSVYCRIPLSKTVSARIPNKNHETLRERCNQLGCTINEYVEHAIEFAMDGSTEFDFDIEEPESLPKIEILDA